MKKRRRVKRKVYIVAALIIIVVIAAIIGINYYKKVNSTSYKLGQLGYDKEDITIIMKQDEAKIDDILNREYNKTIVSLLDEKYFIYDNLDRYLTYFNENSNTSLTDIVTIVNVDRDKDYYTDITKTDTSKDNLLLVNKYNALDKEFAFDDLVDVSVLYSYGSQKIRQEVYDSFIKMFNMAKKEDLTIIINSSYRTYDYQEGLWTRYSNTNGDEWADNYAARAGHSEHQTGLAIDVTTYGVKAQGDFEKTDEYKWLVDNAHKYGFILRYPKDKEDITGYSYESWHYRYVGINVATEIYEKGITYDEYYAYYLK